MNMSYCKFENTAISMLECMSDLQDLDADTVTAFYNNLSSDYERRGFKLFLQYCLEVAKHADDMLEALDKS